MRGSLLLSDVVMEDVILFINIGYLLTGCYDEGVVAKMKELP